MVQNVNPTFVKTPNAQVTQFTTGVGISQSYTTIYTGGANGSKIVGVMISASTSAAADVRIAVTSSNGIQGAFNTVNVSSVAGIVSSVPAVNGMTGAPVPVDSDGNPFVLLVSSAWTLQAELTNNSSQWTTGSFMNFTVLAGDF